MALRNCAVCETPFTVRPQAPHGKFCSTKCRMSHHRATKRKPVDVPQLTIEVPTMKESQRQADTAEHLRSYIARHCNQYSAREIAEHLDVSIRVVDLFYPRASR